MTGRKSEVTGTGPELGVLSRAGAAQPKLLKELPGHRLRALVAPRAKRRMLAWGVPRSLQITGVQKVVNYAFGLWSPETEFW